MSAYEPLRSGPHAGGTYGFEINDRERSRTFPCEIWYPAQTAERDAAPEPGRRPLILYSHSSGRRNRLMASYLCTYLATHGYAVAALDHSEVFASDRNVESICTNRLLDIRLLVRTLLDETPPIGLEFETSGIGLVGHSLGGWTVLAAPEVEPRVAAVVAFAPAGSSNPRPGILPAVLNFAWGRDVPTLFVTGDADCMTPLEGVRELYERTPATKRLALVHGADHLHFMDDPESEHEFARSMPLPPQLVWLRDAMRPFGELCSAAAAHDAARGRTLAHFDAHLRSNRAAERWLDSG